jgi:apolipoprotein N-acyltransferase
VLKDVLWDLGIGDYALGEELGILSGNLKVTLLDNSNSQNEYDYKTAVAICFESVFADHMRRYVKKGAEFLIIITNDAWFGKTSAPFQHTQIAAFRAIENRIPIARCANTGVSMFIDSYGHVTHETPIWVRTAISGELVPRQETTFFSLHGHVITKIISFFNLLPFIFAIFTAIKRKRA